MLIIRIFFVGLVSFTPTGDEDWLALLLDAQDEYGIAAHAPRLYYCDDDRVHPLERCHPDAVVLKELRNQRLSFDFQPQRRVDSFAPHMDSCDPDDLQAPNNQACAKDYRWIAGVRRTLGRYTKRRWCCRDWPMLRACNSVSRVVLEHGRLQNCRFVEGGPPTLPTRAIYGLAGLSKHGWSRVASEVSMVKIEVTGWQADDRFVLRRQRRPYVPLPRDDEAKIELHGMPCANKQVCIDILIDNRPHHAVGQTYRSLTADHFDLYRTVWGRGGRRAGKVQPQLNEGLQVDLGLQPCAADESPLLAGELVLGAGNERPICPENASN
jgi:hypothetical protein